MSIFKTLSIATIPALLICGGAFAQDAAAPVASAAPAPVLVEKKICKSDLETGSLVKKHKVCLTKKQWLYVTDASSDDARRIVQDNAGRPTGN